MPLIIMFAILGRVLDMCLTVFVMSRGGVELNPLVHWVGWPMASLINVAVVIFVIVVLQYLHSSGEKVLFRIGAVWVLVLWWLPVVHNMLVIIWPEYSTFVWGLLIK